MSAIPFEPNSVPNCPIQFVTETFTSTLTSTLAATHTLTHTLTHTDITTAPVPGTPDMFLFMSTTDIAATSIVPIPTTKSLHPRDLLIGVAIGAGPFFISMVIFLFSRRFKRVSKRKGLLASKEQYNTARLQRDPSVETASLRDDDGLAAVSPLGYSENKRSRTSQQISSLTKPYTRLTVTDSPETLSSSPPRSSSPTVTQIQIPTLPITVFQDDSEEDQTETPQESFRMSFRIARNSFVTPTHATSSSYRQHAVRPLPCLPISRQEMNPERISACSEMVEMLTPLPFASSSTASVSRDFF